MTVPDPGGGGSGLEPAKDHDQTGLWKELRLPEEPDRPVDPVWKRDGAAPRRR